MTRIIGARIVPIEFKAQDRPAPEPLVPRPEVGLRWGAQSAFELSAQQAAARPPDGVIIGADPNSSVTIHGVEDSREYEGIRIEPTTGEHIDTEGVRSVTFYIGSRVVERFQTVKSGTIGPSGGGGRVVQPIIETIDEYVRLAFSLSASLSEGRRGAPDPPDDGPDEIVPGRAGI